MLLGVRAVEHRLCLVKGCRAGMQAWSFSVLGLQGRGWTQFFLRGCRARVERRPSMRDCESGRESRSSSVRGCRARVEPRSLLGEGLRGSGGAW